ncbi:hypothetical protein [Aureibacter tunicatorum]|uniref:Phospholipid N-methyltransferase n=1 Tax=Aureibacter tunicatorum TaxID=866807 RepID=A0AAE3XNX8_9BACT|nr:hypothetical protein [Aureibacter tunicatorum]MDR6239932.1 phospholipid N-methyltransferase [Aureibacter tunicatorum]BDD04407.1 hypothetical protein AUTU_18900 [Aureibacter tunicatorum]
MWQYLALGGLALAGLFSNNDDDNEGLGKLPEADEKEYNAFIQKYGKSKSYLNKETGKKIRVYKSAIERTINQRQYESYNSELNDSWVEKFKDLENELLKATYTHSWVNKAYSKNTWFHLFGRSILIKETRGNFYLEMFAYGRTTTLAKGSQVIDLKNISQEKRSKLKFKSSLFNKRKAKIKEEKTNTAPTLQKEETKPAQESAAKSNPQLEIIDYTQKVLALKGTTKEMAQSIKNLGIWAKFNNRLKDENGNPFAGWVFSKKDREILEKFVQEINNGEAVTITKKVSSSSSNTQSHRGSLPLRQHLVAYLLLKEYKKDFVNNTLFQDTAKGIPDLSEHELSESDIKRYRYLDWYEGLQEESNGKWMYKPHLASYMDDEGNIHIVMHYLNRSFESARSEWEIISKAGARKTYYKEKRKGDKDYYKFNKGIQAVLKDGWFYPSNKDLKKYIVNGKQVDANVRKLKEAGYNNIESDNKYRFFVRFKDNEPATAKKVSNGHSIEDLKPFEIPAKVFVPKAKRAPHYKLPDDRKKLKKDVLLQEVLLGKMEWAVSSYWNSYEELTEHVKDYKWEIPSIDKALRVFSERYNTVGLESDKVINIGSSVSSYALRYHGKDAKAYINLESGISPEEQAKFEKKENKSKALNADHNKMADKFETWADRLQDYIDKAKESLKNYNTNTNKRLAQYYSKQFDYNDALELHAFVNALAIAWRNNTIPEKLKLISPVKSKDHLKSFLLSGEQGNQGYSYYHTKSDTPNFEKYFKYYKENLEEIEVYTLEEAKEVFELLKSLVAHDPEREAEKEKQEIEKLVNSWKKSNDKGFFPTPATLAKKLVYKADIIKGHTILEPSAGLGHIADQIKAMHPDNDLEVIEWWNDLRNILKLKGHNVVGEDFLKHTKKYDRIIMNPPFEKLQDIDHVGHAYKLLKPGGRLVAIMSESPFFNSQKKAKAFREWLDEIGGYSEQLPKDSFKGKEAFRQTGVSSRMVIIDKEEAPKKEKKKTSFNLSKVEEYWTKDIHADPKRFQNRANEFSSESKNRIVEAIKNNTFNWAAFDPITIWKDPNAVDKYYVLSGHSRLAAFKEVMFEYEEFENIPAKLFEGTEEEAIQFALNSNTLSTKESDLERATYYANLRKSGESVKDVEKLIRKQEGKNAAQIINLSFLNPKGILFQKLDDFGLGNIESRNNLLTIANWIGEARRKYSQLTNSHENELSTWLIEKAYGNKKGQFSNKKTFLERLHVAIDKQTEFGKFKAGEPLNMERNVSKSLAEQEFDKLLSDAQEEVKEAEKILKEKSTKYYAAVKDGRISQAKADEMLKPHTTSFGLAKSKLNDIASKKTNILSEGKKQMALFGTKK